MLNPVSNSTSFYNQIASGPVEGSFKGKKVIKIDPSYLKRKDLNAAGSGIATLLNVVAIAVYWLLILTMIALAVINLGILPFLSRITLTPAGWAVVAVIGAAIVVGLLKK